MLDEFFWDSFLQIASKFLNLGRNYMKDTNMFSVYCVTGIVSYPEHFTNLKKF